MKGHFHFSVPFTELFNRENFEEWWVLFVHMSPTLVRFYILWNTCISVEFSLVDLSDTINCTSAF